MILKYVVHAHLMASGFITGVLPAAFGLAGTITGGLIAQRGTRIQRQTESDIAARAALARLTRAAADCVYPRSDHDPRDLRFAYLDAKDAGFIAMLGANLPRDVADWILKVPDAPEEKPSNEWRKSISARADHIFRILEVHGVRREHRIRLLLKKIRAST